MKSEVKWCAMGVYAVYAVSASGDGEGDGPCCNCDRWSRQRCESAGGTLCFSGLSSGVKGGVSGCIAVPCDALCRTATEGSDDVAIRGRCLEPLDRESGSAAFSEPKVSILDNLASEADICPLDEEAKGSVKSRRTEKFSSSCTETMRRRRGQAVSPLEVGANVADE